MLQAPNESPYDLNFQLLGFPVRISWTFWLGAVIIGHSFAVGIDSILQASGGSPGVVPLLILWTCCLFVSVLIHELGHAYAFRQYGIYASVVLYHFGGLAIPIGSSMPGRSISRLPPKQDLWITLAGPLAQLASAAIVIAVVQLSGHRSADAFLFMPAGLHRIAEYLPGDPISNPGLYALVIFYIFPSILWALLNLMPVLPLDGGRIARSLILMFGGTTVHALWLSVITAGALAFYAFTNDQGIMGIFFAMFGVSSFQQLQQAGGGRY